VTKDGAETSCSRLPEETERRLRFATPMVTTNKAQKRHSGKKTTCSERANRQKELDGDQTNVTSSTLTSDKSITLVFI